MLPFSALLLRDYYKSIGWNEDNSYSQLNRSSNGPSSQRSLTAHLTDVVQLFCESNPFPSLTARHSRWTSDFQIPQSLVLQLANSPTPIFFTSYSLDALPQLNGSISYITTSDPLEDVSRVNLIFVTFTESGPNPDGSFHPDSVPQCRRPIPSLSTPDTAYRERRALARGPSYRGTR